MTSSYMRSLGEALIARADGATVQGEFGGGEWQDMRDDELYHLLKDGDCGVRVKPVPDTVFRQFNNSEELVSEYCRRFGVERKAYEAPSIWVKHKYNNSRQRLISSLWRNCVGVGGATVVMLDKLYEEYVFLDGSPCGVEEG